MTLGEQVRLLGEPQSEEPVRPGGRPVGKGPLCRTKINTVSLDILMGGVSGLLDGGRGFLRMIGMNNWRLFVRGLINASPGPAHLAGIFKIPAIYPASAQSVGLSPIRRLHELRTHRVL